MKELNREKKTMAVLVIAFALLMSIPYLIPHMGWVALFGFVPLLCMDRIASICGMKKVWIWHYCAFVLWNAFTTFWVCNATIGGGIFAVMANAFQMSIIFGTFRLSKKVFKGTLPYILLAAMWIAWERIYFDAEISWPWLTLGNSFARTIRLAQWYEFTGTLGGSLWIWVCNLSIFGIMCSMSDGSIFNWNNKAKIAAAVSISILFLAPITTSLVIWDKYEESNNPVDVAIFQPNFDPYHKFQFLSQDQQNAILEDQMKSVLSKRDSSDSSPLLLLAPETFTSDVVVNSIDSGKTWRRFRNTLAQYPGANLIYGASATEYIWSEKAPSKTARPAGEGVWRESRNSALILDGSGRTQIFHKSKLVVGVEKTPYPGFFCKIDDMLGGVMGRCIGQEEISLLNMNSGDRQIPVGCAICYESIYGEYCTNYVRKGAELMTVITNDAWWGDTPGYKQHLSYASLRAIELRRDIARCANTGISAIINQRGEIVSHTNWWEDDILKGEVNLNDELTFFVREGDIIGRLSVFIFCLLALMMFVRFTIRKNG